MSKNRISVEKKVALVTGGNRGIGFEVCRQLAVLGARVVLTSRNETKGKEAQTALRKVGVEVDYCRLDVTDDAQIIALKAHVEQHYGRLDILVNNAGILPDNLTPGEFSDRSILDTDRKLFVSAFETNALAVIQLCKAVVPLMKKNRFGRIVNVSSQVAQLTAMDSGIPAYRISKVALNAITRILADELKDYSILCNCVSPGWVKTDMGGPQANLSVEEGAKQIVDLACLADDGPTGTFFRNNQAIEW